MATEIETLSQKLDLLAAALAPLTRFVDQWHLKEQRPGLYSKFPVATPFRPVSNRTIVIALAVADAFTGSLSPGFYDITADNDCFIALNEQARLAGSYPIRGGLVYGPMLISNQDVLHVIAAAAGGNIYISPVE